MSLKSTIDKIGSDIATAIDPDLDFVNIDDPVNTEQILASDEDALIWQILHMGEEPRDPMYSVEFGIGAKTSADAGNYDMMGILDAIGDHLYEGAEFPVKDYSGATASAQNGYLYISGVVVDPQQFDRVSGIRFMSVSARALSYG